MAAGTGGAGIALPVEISSSAHARIFRVRSATGHNETCTYIKKGVKIEDCCAVHDLASNAYTYDCFRCWFIG